MIPLLESIESSEVRSCISDAYSAVQYSGSVEEVKSARLTLSALLNYGAKEARRTPHTVEDDNALRSSLIHSGVNLFGAMFNPQSTNVSKAAIFQELARQGFHTGCLHHLNQAQLNLFFASLKEAGLVTDQYFSGYMCYST